MIKSDQPWGAVTVHRERLKKMICEAYQRGYSLFEIVRITGTRNPSFAYNALRSQRMFPRLPPGRPKNPATLRPDIRKIFADFSVSKWANMWGFSQVDIERILSSDCIDCGISSAIHDALQRDFPDQYKKLFPRSALNYRDTVRLRKGAVVPTESLSVTVRYDTDMQWYTAMVISEPALIGHGYTWTQAISDLEKIWWVHKAITRIKMALDIKSAAGC